MPPRCLGLRRLEPYRTVDPELASSETFRDFDRAIFTGAEWRGGGPV